MEYDKNGNWLQIWKKDTESLICCMVRNLASDIEAGYDPFGNSITNSINELVKYKSRREMEMKILQETMNPEQINKWCWEDLIRRGAIE